MVDARWPVRRYAADGSHPQLAPKRPLGGDAGAAGYKLWDKPKMMRGRWVGIDKKGEAPLKLPSNKQLLNFLLDC